MRYPAPLQNLIDHLSKLPTVGPKTAERFAFFLLRQNPAFVNSLAQSLLQLQSNLSLCQHCYTITSASPCHICSDTKRLQNILCVVADTKDLIAIENSGQFKGRYHVLNGTISALNSPSSHNLTIKQLLLRLKHESIDELIIALNPDLEGETTALYLAKLLADSHVRLTRLARGLPAGASLDYADPMTLAHALNFRRNMT